MKSKIPCDVIKDLLPLYLDELTSETTDREVKLHVSECESCKRSLQLMKNPDMIIAEEEEKEIKFLKKNRKINLMIILTAIIFSVLVILMISVILQKKSEVRFELASFAVEAKRGDTFFFGEYEQDGDLENGPEPIEWIVLKNKDNKLYALSKYGLDNKPYHDKREAVTWETCSLREWLNDEFYEAAFSTEEKAMIADTELTNADNPYRNTEGGNDTIDKVFLLSYKEFEPQAFAYDLCLPTVYGEMQGIYVDTKWITQCDWWLRTVGINEESATYGAKDGGSSGGYGVNYDGAAVRPCINIEY